LGWTDIYKQIHWFPPVGVEGTGATQTKKNGGARGTTKREKDTIKGVRAAEERRG